jgi:hypothetical protein
MNIDFNLIQKKYPKGYSKFIDFLRYNNCIMYCDYTIRYKDVSIGFLFIYALLEKFFDDNGIMININYLGGWFWYKLEPLADWKGILDWNKEGIKTRDGAKEQAIYKAFEIMEEIKSAVCGSK